MMAKEGEDKRMYQTASEEMCQIRDETKQKKFSKLLSKYNKEHKKT